MPHAPQRRSCLLRGGTLAAVLALAGACAPMPDIGAPAVPAAARQAAPPPRLVPLGPALAAAEAGTLTEASGDALAASAAALRVRAAALPPAAAASDDSLASRTTALRARGEALPPAATETDALTGTGDDTLAARATALRARGVALRLAPTGN